MLAVYIVFILCTQILTGHLEKGNEGQKGHMALSSLHQGIVLTPLVSAIHLIKSVYEMGALNSLLLAMVSVV